MDRTQQSIRRPYRRPLDPTFRVESALFSAPAQETTCALFAPLHYEPGYAYPLIVWLHGPGSDERQLLRTMPLVSMRNYVAVAPRGARITIDRNPARKGYGWEQSEEHIQQAEQQVFGSIEVARQKFHVSRRRIFLAGFDCGGTMAFRVAMNYPGWFAGVVSFCGSFPRDRTPLGYLTEARRLPILLAVGRYSREYPSKEVCENLRLFHSAGLLTTLRQYPCGHELTPQMLSDMNRWIIEEINPTVESDQHSSHDVL